LNADKGAEFIKADLHVHTPASGDAQSKNRYNFKFDINDIPGSLKRAKQIALDVVNRCKELGIKLIAITDHNCPSNTHPEDLTNSWYQLINDAAKGEELCVLPGVEISTDDLHILVILDPREEDPAAFTTHRINFLLKDCKFDLDEYGDYRSTGMSSLFDVLQYIENLDTNCIIIPAHIDGGNKAMLSVYKEPSNVYNKLLNHPNLNAVEVVKDTTPTRKKIGKKYVGEYFTSLRDDDRPPLAYIQNSDGHSLKENGLGKRFTYIRMGELGFWGLKNALEDPETRVRMQKDHTTNESRTYILGMAFKKTGKYSYLAFNKNLNTIVGKKNTQKSKLLDLILYGLKRFTDDEAARENKIKDEGYSIDIFIKKADALYCFRRGKHEEAPTVYKLEGETFQPVDTMPDLELPRRYNHNAIMELFGDKAKRMAFLDKHVYKSAKMTSYIQKREEYIAHIKEKGLDRSKTKLKSLVKICEKLYDERLKCIDLFSEKYLDIRKKELFRIRVKEGKWKSQDLSKLKINTLSTFFTDEIDIKALVDRKYKDIRKLRTGERNAVQMVLLMNQDAFGTLIIDEPERYLDVASMIRIVIPQMRNLKSKQQIICVTNDEHILLSGDAEHVIVTTEEKKIKLITGDVNSKHIQDQIIEIFEGGKKGLSEKNHKLKRLLE
jgi:PHP family Zn ribbon phosphoesterase